MPLVAIARFTTANQTVPTIAEMIIVNRLLLLILALASVLAVFPSASGAKTIPPLKDTQQYKALASYVVEMEAKSSIPVDTPTRNQYLNSLNTKVSLANDRVTMLFSNRKTRALNQSKSSLRKAVKKIRNKERRNLKKAKRNLSKALAANKADYQREIDKIKSQFGPEIKATKKTIAKLEKAKAKTRNPRKQVALEEKINENQVILQNLTADQSADKNQARKALKRQAKAERQDFRASADRIENKADRAVNKRTSTSKLNYRTRVEELKDRRSVETSQVNVQKTKGEAAINAMPPVVPLP